LVSLALSCPALQAGPESHQTEPYPDKACQQGDGVSQGERIPSVVLSAVLRAKEIHAEILLKATKVDGVYDSDPVKNKDAAFIKKITYREVLEKRLQVMDMTAISLAMDNQLPLIVFNLRTKGNIRKFVCGEDIGTRIIS